MTDDGPPGEGETYERSEQVMEGEYGQGVSRANTKASFSPPTRRFCEFSS